MWTIFKIFIESIIILLLFYALVFWALKHEGSKLSSQGENPHPLHWKARSWPLGHQGSPQSRQFWGISVTELPSLLLNFIYISLVQTSILNIQLKFLISSLSFNRLTPNIFQELFPGPPNLNWVLFLCVSRAPYLWHNIVPNSTVNFLRINTVF